MSGTYHSGDRFEDLGVVLPLSIVQSIARRTNEITTIGVVKLGFDAKAVTRRLEDR